MLSGHFVPGLSSGLTAEDTGEKGSLSGDIIQFIYMKKLVTQF